VLTFLFYLFIALSILLVLPGIRNTARIFEFPFFMGVTFLGFMGPHIYAIVQRNYPMPEEIALRGLTMTCLCVAMSWLGYHMMPSAAILDKLKCPVSDQRLFHVGALYALIATYFFFMVRAHPGATGSQWSGSVLRYLFFTGLSAPALAICTVYLLRRSTPWTMLFFGLALIAPLYSVYVGRRGLTFMFLVTIGFSLFYVKGFKLPRWALAFALIVGTIHTLNIAEYRYLRTSGKLDLTQLLDMNIERNLNRAIGKTRRGISETAYGYYIMDSVSRRGSYEFGSAFWNMLIVFYVPGQLVGYDFKKDLQINIGAGDFTDLNERLRVDLNTGTTLTGIYSAFKQFSYFGCLLFFFYGVAYRHLYALVIERRNTIIMALYPAMVIYGMYIITHHIAYATTQFVFYASFCVVGYIYARKGGNESASIRRQIAAKKGGANRAERRVRRLSLSDNNQIPARD